MAILEILRFIFFQIALPLYFTIRQREQVDPVFKRMSDEAFREWNSAVTTADRKAAAKKLYELQKSG